MKKPFFHPAVVVHLANDRARVVIPLIGERFDKP